MARPNNIVEKNRRAMMSQRSMAGKSGHRMDGSAFDRSDVSDGAGDRMGLKRRGTVNLVKNYMFSKIQNVHRQANQAGSETGGNDFNNLDASQPFSINMLRSRVNNQT